MPASTAQGEKKLGWGEKFLASRLLCRERSGYLSRVSFFGIVFVQVFLYYFTSYSPLFLPSCRASCMHVASIHHEQ